MHITPKPEKYRSIKSNLLIRADGDQTMGLGHLMRCLSLAQAWTDRGGNAQFVCAACPPILAERFKSEGFSVTALGGKSGGGEDLRETLHLAQANDVDWIVLDGYHFGPDFSDKFSKSGIKVLEIDDCAPRRPFQADILLNQNIYADAGLYPDRGSATRLLTGSRYVLLRREFWPLRGQNHEIRKKADRMLITMGGSDPENITGRILESLRGLESQLTVMAVVGAANPHLDNLKTIFDGFNPESRLMSNVREMSDLMKWADFAIIAAGSTCWEMAFMGLPSLMFVLAENQKLNAESLAECGLSVNFGSPHQFDWELLNSHVLSLMDDLETRKRMSQRGQQLVDGYGLERILAAMFRESVWLRKAQSSDCAILWEWANDPVARGNSFSSVSIPWQDHIEWFQKRIENPDCLLLIAANDADDKVGYVRFEFDGTRATISIALAPSFRGQGFGRKIVHAGIRELMTKRPASEVHAFIKPNNIASIKVFSDTGFTQVGCEMLKGQDALHFILNQEVAP